MTFRRAFKKMMNGHKIRRKGWGGYWYMNDKNETVIHTKEGCEISHDFNNSTILNCAANDWEIVK